MASLSSYRSSIKSIQRGALDCINDGQTATISSVNTAKATLHLVGTSTNDDQTDAFGRRAVYWRGTLTNATTVTFNVNLTGAKHTIVSWEVIEYY